ncbi:hypothetical protein J6590_035073 [Homalodisca vitripennis]|nr:hypothetical protein J6590_035073 [Homalodisca vitripennis]
MAVAIPRGVAKGHVGVAEEKKSKARHCACGVVSSPLCSSPDMTAMTRHRHLPQNKLKNLHRTEQ